MSLLQEAKDLLAATEDGAAECWSQRNLYQTAASALALLAAMVVEAERLRKAERIVLIGDCEWAVSRNWIPEPVFREWVQARLELEGWGHLTITNVRQIDAGCIEPAPDLEDTYRFSGGNLPMTICDLEEAPQ